MTPSEFSPSASSESNSNLTVEAEASRLLATEIAPIVIRQDAIKTLAIAQPNQVALMRPHNDFNDTGIIPIQRNRFLEDWQVGKIRRRPIKVIEPVPELSAALRSGDFWLWADLIDQQAFYSLAVPRLRQFSLTVQKENRNNTTVISGGSAILEVSLFAEEDALAIERYRQIWTDALAQAGHASRTWKFLPLQLRNVQASLELAANHASQAPRITTNSDLGRATFIIDLSELGVQVWKEALEQRRGSAIPGVCRINTTFYAQRRDRVSVQQQDLSVSLSALLANIGSEAIVNANLQLSTEAKIVVEWHSSLQTVTLNWRPNNGAAPGSDVFNAASLPLNILLTAQDLNTLEVDWNAQVSFVDPSWPPVTEGGKLSLTNNNFTHILKPTAWVRDYTLIVWLLDDQGNIITNRASSGDLNNRVMGVMNFSAPYLPKKLTEAFETSSQKIAKVSFPVLPGQPAELELSLVSQRNGRDDFQTRKLSIDENLIAVKVYPNARIEIVTSRDRLPESSIESEMLGLLAELEGTPPEPEAAIASETTIFGFHPTTQGFHFANRFKNHPIPGASIIETRGLCGGMSFATLDYYFNGLKIPPQTTADFPFTNGIPGENTRLYKYLYSRQLDSFVSGTAQKFITWAAASDGSVQGWTRSQEFPALKTALNQGRPVVLGLVSQGGVTQSHQVIAYGYDEDFTTGAITIRIYDCNYPDREMTLTFSGAFAPIQELDGALLKKQWKGFFVQAYSTRYPSFMGSNEEVWSDDWSTDWTTFMPFVLNGQPHYLAYKEDSGQVSIDRIQPNLHGVETIWGGGAGTWTTGWTTFMPFVLNGQTHYLAYKIKTGQATIDVIRLDGRGVDTIWGGSWSTGWTTFMPFVLNGQPHYLSYKAETGQMTIDRIRPDGCGSDTIWHDTWTTGWTSFMPFVSRGQAHYLAYKVKTGQVTIDRIRLDGMGVDTIWGGTWSTGWTAFVPFTSGGQQHYLAYKVESGQFSVDRINANLQDVTMLRSGGAGAWSLGWTSFMPFEIGGTPYYLGYKKKDGQMTIGRSMP